VFSEHLLLAAACSTTLQLLCVTAFCLSERAFSLEFFDGISLVGVVAHCSVLWASCVKGTFQFKIRCYGPFLLEGNKNLGSYLAHTMPPRSHEHVPCPVTYRLMMSVNGS
jgi:hypothetical protein